MSAAVINYDRGMGRWQPGARGRLTRAALELYAERGYERTTVAEIAERAGLTERTYFRHFADKREVLFAGSTELGDAMVRAVAAAPESATPVEAVAAGLEAAGAIFRDDREGPRRRQAIIDTTAELRERELIKMASLSAALADALRDRGVPDLTARLTAEAGIAVFKVAFGRWVNGTGPDDLTEAMRESLMELRTVAAG